MSKKKGPRFQMPENENEDQFDPSEHTAPEVVEELKDADEDEKLRIAAAEQADKGRKSVLAAAGVDESVRLDASGRVLNGWEVAPKKVDS